jgi:trk system potassium uptake protein TrkA
MAYAIILGGGKIGYYVARTLINNNYEVLLMEKNALTYRRLAADLGDVVMLGDACDPLTLKAAGIKRADLVIAATGDDEDNLVICQMAAHCFGCRRIIARVNNPDHEQLFDKLGVGERVSSTSAILSLVGQKVGHAPVILLGALGNHLEVLELIVDEGSPLLGARLGELQLPPETLFISVLREEHAMIPGADTVFEKGDVLVALVPQELEAALREFIIG